jgi:PAS domain S-box-containing protein
MKRILIINENPGFVELLRKELIKQFDNIELFVIGMSDEILLSIERLSPELILINFKSANYDFLTDLALVKKKYPSIPILFYNDDQDEKRFFKTDENFLFSGLKKLTALIQNSSEKSQKEESDFIVQSMRRESSLFKRLSATLNSFPDLILIQDNDGTFIDYFSNVDNLLPIKPSELLMKKPEEVFPAQLTSKFESLRNNLIRERQTQQIELSFQFDNIHKIVEFRFIYLDETKTAVILRDVTERKLIETNLTHKAVIADNVDTQVIALDLSFRITYLNAETETTAGVKLKNCKGKPLDQIFKVLSLDTTLTDVKKELQTTGKWVGELVAVSAEGKIEPVNFSFSLLKNSKGIPIGITGVHRFVKKEISLVHFDERTLPVFLNLSDGIAILQDGYIKYSNNAFSRMTGYDENLIKGKSFIEFLHEEDELFIRNYFSKNDEIESFVPGLFEIRFMHRNQINVIYAEVTFDLFAYKGIPSVLAVIKELQTGNWSLNVDDSRSEDNQVQNQSLKRTALTAYLSHDIRTSLNGILGFADILREELKDQKERSNYIYADKIYSGGKRLLNLLDQEFDSQKIDTSSNVIHVKEILLFPLIDEVVSLLKPTAEKRNVKIISSGIIKSPVFADENRLFEALNNIVGNAIERSANNTITIQAMHVKGKPKVQIVVKDSGQLLAKEKLEAVTSGDTEKSFSLDDAPEPTLFRLAISKRLISFMNGEFEISSLTDEGTKTVITLPAVEIAKSEFTIQDTIFFASSTELMYLSQRLPKILVIEDDESSRKMLEITLTKVSRLTMAENGEDALKKIEENEEENNHFQLILMDIGLPGPWDGLKLRAEILRRWNHYRNIPFIAQTAFALKSDKDKITEAGFNDYLSKPIDRKFLIKTIYNQLKK